VSDRYFHITSYGYDVGAYNEDAFAVMLGSGGYGKGENSKSSESKGQETLALGLPILRLHEGNPGQADAGNR
jgi:hypothetical protein